ncbi:uncharacterized protein LOC123314345 isoform X2 [Coccinella septempunctata]|uniref:uncharacterized protein LOC123314345 isoform X2 n=1 Tax=Coccinella septempunctata TaxID=41139 RepID=UPI001D08098D|nr:uncharacterized protein LOC123314345 isoform X2 [Coccinella septempunctata]
MGPVGQIVKILFYVFLSTELFAVYLVVILIIQFLFEMFGVRETRPLWYNTQSLPIDGLPSGKLDLEGNVENFIVEDTDKMAYRVPTHDEIEARKHKLYGKNHEIHVPNKKHKSKWNNVNINSEEDKEIDLPMYPSRKKHFYRRRHGSRSHYDIPGNEFDIDEESLNRVIRLKNPRTPEGNYTEEKLTNTPLVLIFHGYSFILKMVCIVFAVLTGFLYQLEYI